jgi:hypothetical protein
MKFIRGSLYPVIQKAAFALGVDLESARRFAGAHG